MRDRLFIFSGLVLLIALLTYPVWYAALANATANGPALQLPAGQTNCIRDTEWMRHNHMKLLMHERNEVVHQGVRKAGTSLPDCMNCHVSRQADGSYPSVSSKQFFCNNCHSYAGVKIDCFSCHTNRPEQAKSGAAKSVAAHVGGIGLAKNTTSGQMTIAPQITAGGGAR